MTAAAKLLTDGVVKPLSQVVAAVESNRTLRKDIGREAMFLACTQCRLATCNSKISACVARQVKTQRQRDYYLRTQEARRAEAKAYYRENHERMRERSSAYQKDLGNLEIMAAKRRARYARIAAAQGRTVKPYRWANPAKNKGGASVGSRGDAGTAQSAVEIQASNQN